jgi:hypothetical protein
MSVSEFPEQLKRPDLQWILDPADAPHWRLSSESLQTLVKWTTCGHKWEGGLRYGLMPLLNAILSSS